MTNKRFQILCIGIAAAGIILLVVTSNIMKEGSKLFGWLIGLGAALIVLGGGFLISSFLSKMESHGNPRIKSDESDKNIITVKEKAGYLVCKIMNILLCIYLLLMTTITSATIIMILGIVLLIIQFLLDLILQVYLSSRK